VRVLFGEYKGRVLKTPRKAAIRPTTGRMRDWLCNILRDRLPGARVLDLYAGCGTLGIHALSMGAATCTFVDSSPQALRLIRLNLELLGAGDRGTIRRSTVERFLKQCAGQLKYDLLFVDPPYESTDYQNLMAMLGDAELSAERGLVAVEHPGGAPVACPGAELWRRKEFGRSVISIFRHESCQQHRS